MVASVVPVDPFDLVVFGGTGDLARRKLLPALYHRLRDGQMPPEARIIGTARGVLDQDGYRKMAAEALEEFIGKDALDGETVGRFMETLDYIPLDVGTPEGWAEMAMEAEP